MILLLISVLGLGLFVWPFLGLGLPSATAALALGLGAAAGLLGLELGTRRMNSRELALLAALSAADAGLRAALVTGIGGFSPIFLLVLCGGYALGPAFGFLVGACSLLVSALVTGGIGPWVPYQLFALGWVGAAAGLVGRLRSGRRPGWPDLFLLVLCGILCGFGFGAVMDVWNWTFYASVPQLGWSPRLGPAAALQHFGRYYLVTSLAYDAFRAGGNAIMVLLLGLPVLSALRRLSLRFRVRWADAEPDPAAGSGLAPDHVAAGHLVVPALAMAVQGGPGRPQEAGRRAQGQAGQAEQAAPQAEAAAVLLAHHARARQQHAQGAARAGPEEREVGRRQ